MRYGPLFLSMTRMLCSFLFLEMSEEEKQEMKATRAEEIRKFRIREEQRKLDRSQSREGRRGRRQDHHSVPTRR
jgi:hypothetical protein